MVYTSYFGKMKSFPPNMIPIAICGGIPDWYKEGMIDKGWLWYKKLAPKWEFFQVWKQTHDNDYYIRNYNTLVLDKLDANRDAADIQLMLPLETREQMTSSIWCSDNIHVALLCYEKPDDFCHRHLVSKWFNKHGYKCEEWKA